jgi:hypothetical protein
MATSIYFNGARTSRPGAQSKLDATGLDSLGYGSLGRVAILGTAQGGKPMNEITKVDDLIVIKTPGKEGETFRSGDLLEAVPIAFNPANDPVVTGGALDVICCKVNDATQSTGQLSNAHGAAIDLESVDYGAHTQQVNVAIATGTTKGKLVTIVFEDVTEVGDDIGGDTMFTLTYAHGTGGAWETMTAAVVSGGGVEAYGTKTDPGLDGDVTTLAAPSRVEIVSSNAADTTQIVDIFGLSSIGVATRERLTLNGTTAVPTTTTWAADSVWGMEITGTTAGTVTCRVLSGGATVLSAVAGVDPIKGATRGLGLFVGGGVVTVVAGGASTKKLILAGYSAAGVYQVEVLTLAGTTPVVGALTWSRLTTLVMGQVAAATTVTFSATAVATTPAIHDTLTKVADHYNAKIEGGNGFTLTLVTASVDMDPAELDVSASAANIFGPLAPAFLADLWAVINWINDNSAYVTAAMATGAHAGAPSNTTTPLYLVGGAEGTANRAKYLAALNFLKKIEVNTIVALTGDPSVHADIEAHCAYMCGAGRKERDGVVGLLNTGLTDVPTKTEIKTQIAALNSRHVRAVAEAFDRYDRNGVKTEYLPPFLAVAVAGMQAGTSVGEPLTRKYLDVLDVRCDSSWDQEEDVEEMLTAGLMFTERVDGQGFRWCRNITTYTRSSNLAYTEASANQAANYAAQLFRTDMETQVGRKGTGQSLVALKALGETRLDQLVADEVLVAWRSLQMARTLDNIEVSVEMAPVTPDNFITITMHLVAVRTTA